MIARQNERLAREQEVRKYNRSMIAVHSFARTTEQQKCKSRSERTPGKTSYRPPPPPAKPRSTSFHLSADHFRLRCSTTILHDRLPSYTDICRWFAESRIDDATCRRAAHRVRTPPAVETRSACNFPRNSSVPQG